MTIFFAVMATALFAFLALTIDGGLAFSKRRLVQNASDAGSLAGTRELAKIPAGSYIYDSSVREAVEAAARSNSWVTATGSLTATYITTNRVPLGAVGTFGTGPPPADARGVWVTTTTNYSTFFGGFIGINQLKSQADAKSIWGYACSAKCLFPVTVYSSTFNGDAQYSFLDGSTGPGNFGWTCFTTPCSATNLVEDLNNNLAGRCNTLQSNTWVPGSSGMSAGGGASNVAAALDRWKGKTAYIAIFGPGPGTTTGCGNTCPGGSCPATCDAGNNLQYHIVGFAAFNITGYDLTGHPKRITGEFRTSVADSELTPGCTATTGVLAINLIK